MTYEIPGQTRSYEAVADLSGSYYRFVKLSGGIIVAVTAVTDGAVGVLQNKPNRPASNLGVGTPSYGLGLGGERTSGTVMINGVTRVFAGKALAAGVHAYLDATGAVTDVVQAGQCVGVTETACTAAGQLVSLLLKPLGSIV